MELLFFDLDGTLRGGNLAEWFGFLKSHGLIKDATWRRMLTEDRLLRSKRQNIRQFSTNIMNLYAGALKGVPITAVEHLATDFVQQPDLLKMHEFAEPLVNLMNDHCITTLVTGQPIELSRAIARKFGMTDCMGDRIRDKEWDLYWQSFD